jgi:hypothetical protein
LSEQQRGLVDNSRITRRTNSCENSHRILLAAERKAAIIESMIVKFSVCVVGQFQLPTVAVCKSLNGFLSGQNEEPEKVN